MSEPAATSPMEIFRPAKPEMGRTSLNSNSPRAIDHRPRPSPTRASALR
jgi:hypothetical protein